MDAKEVVTTLAAAALGSGIGTALVSWLQASLTERRTRRLEFAERQLQDLYGPLFYCALHNERLMLMSRQFHAVYQKVYCDQKWSSDPKTQASLGKDTTATIDIANSYVDLIIKNNERMAETIQRHFHLADVEDANLFQSFVLDLVRWNTERKQTPHRIADELPDICFYDPEFVATIKVKVAEKNAIVLGGKVTGHLLPNPPMPDKAPPQPPNSPT